MVTGGMVRPAPFISMGDIFRIIIITALLTGCSGSTNTGLCRSIGGIFTHSWPSSDINISETGDDWRDAGTMWKEAGLTFNYGIPGQIEFGGYVADADYCGYATWHQENTVLKKCVITLNPTLIEKGACKSERLVIAHEIGHCLGIGGHIFVSEGGNLMDPTGGTYIDESVIESIRKLYANTEC